MTFRVLVPHCMQQVLSLFSPLPPNILSLPLQTSCFKNRFCELLSLMTEDSGMRAYWVLQLNQCCCLTCLLKHIFSATKILTDGLCHFTAARSEGLSMSLPMDRLSGGNISSTYLIRLMLQYCFSSW